MNLMQQCWEMERGLEGMGIIGGGMIGGPPLFLLLPVLFFVWALGLGVVAAAGRVGGASVQRAGMIVGRQAD